MFSFFGLGKKRTTFGKWADRRGIAQIDLEEKAKLSRRTISRLYNDDEYTPKYETIVKIKKALKSLGHDFPDDYFDV